MANITEYNIEIKFKESGAESTAKSIDKVTSSSNKLKSVIKSLGIGVMLKKATDAIGGFINKSANYIETMNYFSASMGDASEKAREFVNEAESALGLDPKSVMDSISAFKNLADGFGVSSDRAYLMSQNLTQLAGDLSSFANISFEDAQRKLLSGFSGQVKPLREYGIALNQASLQETAYSLGLKQRVQDMTMAQKSELIYYQIMTSTTKMQGDLARTLSSPANALRLMKTEFNKLAREVGNVFIPIMMKIIPVVIAVTEILLDAVKAIARFFHIDVDSYKADTEGIGNMLEGIGGGIEDIGTSADDTSKKLNKMLMPFDELNNITSNSGTAGGIGGAGGFGGGLGIDLPEYNAFEGISKKIREEADEIKRKLKELLPIILIVVGALAGLFIIWKIVKFVTGLKKGADGLGDSMVSLKTGFNKFLESAGKALLVIAILGGLALVIESITHLIEAFSDSGLTLKDTLILLGGILLEVVAAFSLLTLVLSKVDIPIKSIAGAIVILLGLTAVLFAIDGIITSLGDSGLEITDILIGLGGILLEIAALGAILLALGTALQSPMAMAGVLVITLAIAAVLFTISETIPYILDAIAIFIEDIGPTVINIIEKIGEVLDEVIHALGEVLPPIIESLGNTFDIIFNGISKVVSTVGETVSKIIETIGKTVSTILSGIKDVIKQIGDTIQQVAQTIIWFINSIGPAISRFADSLMTTTTRIVNFVISGVEYLVNRVIDGINELAKAANQVPGVNITKKDYISISRFKAYAEGGFPTTGQLFVANEAGPELVGNIGNRTAVANKDQITTAIANATYQAMSRALAENGQNDGQPIIVNVGNEQLYKGYAGYQKQRSNMYGINV